MTMTASRDNRQRSWLFSRQSGLHKSTDEIAARCPACYGSGGITQARGIDDVHIAVCEVCAGSGWVSYEEVKAFRAMERLR